MGVFSSIFSALGSLDSASETQDESPESMRKKHGFSDFSTDMKRMQNYDPEKEMQKEELPPPHQAASTHLPRKKK